MAPKWLFNSNILKLQTPSSSTPDFAALKSVMKRIDAAIISTQPPNPKISPTIKWHTKMTPSNVQLYHWCISIQLQNIRNQCSPGKFLGALPRKWSPETEHRYPKMIRCVKAIYLFQNQHVQSCVLKFAGCKTVLLVQGFQDFKSLLANKTCFYKHPRWINGDCKSSKKIGHNKTINKNISWMILPE